MILASKLSELDQCENWAAKYWCNNTTRQNVLKWRITCTALILDLVYFNGPHTKFNNLYPFEGPCRYSSVTVTSVMVFVGPGKVHVSFGPDYSEYCRCGIFGEVCPIPLFGAC